MRYEKELFRSVYGIKMMILTELIIFSGRDIAGSAGVIRDITTRERQIQFALRLEF